MNLILPIIIVAVFAAQLSELVLKILNLHSLEQWYRRTGKDGDLTENRYQYQRALQHLALFSAALNGLMYLLFLALRLPAWLFDQLGQLFGQHRMWHGLAFIAVLQVARSILQLPWGLYRRFVVEERFGFNRMRPKEFVKDVLRSTMLVLVFGLPLLWGLFRLMDAPVMWWLWGFLTLAGYQILLFWLYPIFIAPLFNRFVPLSQDGKQGLLRLRLEQLLDQCNFAAKGLFIMDGSKRSRHSNAYFTGFGKIRRIVLFDTLIEDLDQEQLAAVLAHEIGHYRKKHIPKRLMQSLFWLFISFLGLYLLSGWQSLFVSFGFEMAVGQPNPALLLFVGMVLSSPPGLILQKLGNHLSRSHEFEADAYAVRVMGNSKSLTEALETLHRENLSNPAPHPGYVAQYYSHPPLPERLAALG